MLPSDAGTLLPARQTALPRDVREVVKPEQGLGMEGVEAGLGRQRLHQSGPAPPWLTQ